MFVLRVNIFPGEPDEGRKRPKKNFKIMKSIQFMQIIQCRKAYQDNEPTFYMMN